MKRRWATAGPTKIEWIKQSLLVHFHNEAWGGEKVFILLERLIREPVRYQDLLEFLIPLFFARLSRALQGCHSATG